MRAKQLKKYIIEPTLKYFSSINERYKSIYSPEAVKLLLMTAAVESDMGKYIIQNNNKMNHNDKALGIYQIERSTILWIMRKRNNMLLLKIIELINNDFGDAYNRVISDMCYATIMTRLVYWYKTKDPIPPLNDNEKLWRFYKKWYNSSIGSTTKDKFFKLCNKHSIT